MLTLTLTIAASFAAAPLIPLLQSRRHWALGIIWLVGYAIVLFGLVGPLAGRDARDACVAGYVAGLGASAVAVIVQRWVTRSSPDTAPTGGLDTPPPAPLPAP